MLSFQHNILAIGKSITLSRTITLLDLLQWLPHQEKGHAVSLHLYNIPVDILVSHIYNQSTQAETQLIPPSKGAS